MGCSDCCGKRKRRKRGKRKPNIRGIIRLSSPSPGRAGVTLSSGPALLFEPRNERKVAFFDAKMLYDEATLDLLSPHDSGAEVEVGMLEVRATTSQRRRFSQAGPERIRGKALVDRSWVQMTSTARKNVRVFEAISQAADFDEIDD